MERVVAGLSCAKAGEQIAAELLDPVSGFKISALFNPGDLETVTVFSPTDAPFVCIEPRTGIPLDLSDDTPAPPTGKTLQPAGESGDTMKLNMVFRIEGM